MTAHQGPHAELFSAMDEAVFTTENMDQLTSLQLVRNKKMYREMTAARDPLIKALIGEHAPSDDDVPVCSSCIDDGDDVFKVWPCKSAELLHQHVMRQKADPFGGWL